MKYYINQNNEIARKYTIKDIFAENWSMFVREMASQGKLIRKTIMEEVEKIIGCQDPKNGFRFIYVPKMPRNQACSVHL